MGSGRLGGGCGVGVLDPSYLPPGPLLRVGEARNRKRGRGEREGIRQSLEGHAGDEDRRVAHWRRAEGSPGRSVLHFRPQQLAMVDRTP